MEKLTSNFKITFTKGDTYALSLKFKNTTEDLRLAFFTVKENPDDEPLIQKSLGAGIAKTDDRAYKNEKTYKVQLQAEDTANLEAHVQYLYDLQVTVGNVVKTVLSGVFVVNQTVTGTGTGTTTQSLDVAVDDELEVEVSTTEATNGVEYEQDPVANAKIGDLTALNTTNKETLVEAINEAKSDATANTEDLYKIKNGTLPVPKASGYTEDGEIAEAITELNANVESVTNSVEQIIGGQTATPLAERAYNADKINNIEITKDANGVLKIGDVIIPQKKLLYENADGLRVSTTEIGLDDLTGADISNKTIEIHYALYSDNKYTVGVAGIKREQFYMSQANGCFAVCGYFKYDSYDGMFTVTYENGLKISGAGTNESIKLKTLSGWAILYKIYEIID